MAPVTARKRGAAPVDSYAPVDSPNTGDQQGGDSHFSVEPAQPASLDMEALARKLEAAERKAETAARRQADAAAKAAQVIEKLQAACASAEARAQGAASDVLEKDEERPHASERSHVRPSPHVRRHSRSRSNSRERGCPDDHRPSFREEPTPESEVQMHRALRRLHGEQKVSRTEMRQGQIEEIEFDLARKRRKRRRVSPYMSWW